MRPGLLPGRLTASQLGHGQRQRLADDLRRTDDTYHAGHRDAPDPDMARVVPENLLGRHVAEQRGHALADGDRLSVGEMADERNQYEPYGKRTGADIRGIAEPDDIAQTEHGGSGIDLEDKLRLIGQQRSPLGQTRRDVLGPPAERADRKVVQSSGSDRCRPTAWPDRPSSRRTRVPRSSRWPRGTGISRACP